MTVHADPDVVNLKERVVCLRRSGLKEMSDGAEKCVDHTGYAEPEDSPRGWVGQVINVIPVVDGGEEDDEERCQMGPDVATLVVESEYAGRVIRP